MYFLKDKVMDSKISEHKNSQTLKTSKNQDLSRLNRNHNYTKPQKTIEHKGIIKKISENSIFVNIISKSACISCSAKGICSVSDIDEKEIEVKKNSTNYSVGEEVKVYYKESLGYRALFLGYILPFSIIMTTLIIMLAITHKEGLAGIIAFASMLPYYLILYLNKNKFKKTFNFSIKKIVKT